MQGLLQMLLKNQPFSAFSNPSRAYFRNWHELYGDSLMDYPACLSLHSGIPEMRQRIITHLNQRPASDHEY